MAEGVARGLRRFAVLLAVAVVALPRPGSAQSSEAEVTGPAAGPAVFNASAAAAGIQLRAEVPGAPVTSTPVDAGGPSAQARASSTGVRSAYAALPDPGEIIVNAPSLIAGALAGGSGGALPPASPPDYPFYVQAGVEQTGQSAGSGPYRLEARSDDTESRASATAGFETGAGSLALVRSTSSVVRTTDTVVAEAAAATESLSIGPLTIAQVRSAARMTLDSAGTIVPDMTLEVTGMRIGTVPVSLTPDGLVVGSTAHELPAGRTVNDLLAPSKITVEVVAAQRHPDRVIAPALRLVFPVDASPSGQGPTMMTALVGFATVMLNGAATETAGTLPSVDPAERRSATPPAASGAGSQPLASQAPGPAPSGGGGLTTPAVGGGGGALAAAPPLASDAATGTLPAIAAPAPAMGIAQVGVGFGLGAIYFTLVASAVGLLFLSVLIHELGVRHP